MANPYLKPYKVHYIDKMLNWIGSTFIGRPDQLADGRFHMLPGFYHRRHRRQNIRSANAQMKRVLTASHGFRVEFSRKMAKTMALVVGGGSAIVAFAVALIALMAGGAQ